ncbi:MAG TPA: acylneuraminate cytidylyltransferase family protein [Phycisphaerales bacterium]|nr:acylneuraminate cytidylyltransferase family protein [Phycisphaerales bacterium]
MSKTVCLIPARGGSKRIPRKNILPLAGKPLIAYTIEAAVNSGVFDDVVISSDNDEILAIGESFGAIGDRRPVELSGDKIRFVQVIEEYLLRNENEGKYQNVAGLLPTCPFRTVEDLRNAFELFNEQNEDECVISVTEYDFPTQLALAFEHDSQRLHMLEHDSYNRTTRSQDISKTYHPNGAIYLSTVEGFLREKTFFTYPLIGYVMTAEHSFDIDYPYQFRIAEFMMKEVLERV